jgi:hypothetical protein
MRLISRGTEVFMSSEVPQRGKTCGRPLGIARWCAALDRTCVDLLRAERESGALALRARARLVRWFYEFLVLFVIGIAELVGLWHEAGRALAVPPKRRG